MSLRITDDALTPGYLSAPYYHRIKAQATPEGELAWSVSGSLPEGLSLNAQTGELTGSCIKSFRESRQFTVQRESPAELDSKPFLLAFIKELDLAIQTASLPAAKLETQYHCTLAGSGGRPPHVWSTDGLPIGLSLSGADIEGSPLFAGGKAPVRVTLTDADGYSTHKDFHIEVLI